MKTESPLCKHCGSRGHLEPKDAAGLMFNCLCCGRQYAVLRKPARG